ncbi:MAG: PAS domain S-box protein [Deltaproteobacteria bacterium]|nr:PAS domain S-box protein [Deltaproteobacteria bacterium]
MIDQETQRLASILDAMGCGVYIIGDDYTVQFMNKASINIFGEGIGKKCYQVIANQDDICSWCRAKEVFKGENLRWENYFPHIDKTFEIFELPLQTDKGTISHFCIYQDITETKEREKMLRASIEDYKKLFEHVRVGVHISSKEGKFIDANQALMEMLGYTSKEEFLKVDIARDLYLKPEDRRKYMDLIERDGHVIDYEVDLKRKDGRVISVLRTAHARYDREGKVIGYEGICVDQTQRKEMERKLKKAHDFQTNLIQTSIDPIIANDRKGNIIIFNKGAENVFGYTQEEVSKIHVTRFYKEGEAKKIKRMIYGPEHGGGGRLLNYKVEIVDKYGQIVPILLSATLLYEEGQEVATVGYFKDMREVKRLQQELQTLFEFEHNLIQSSIDAIIASDRDGSIVVFNQQAEKLLGYSAYEMIMKMSFNDLFPPAMLEEVRKELVSDEYGGKNRLILFETYMINKTGDKIPVQLSATVMFDQDEEIGMVGFFRDLREIRRMEQQFADQTRLIHEHKMISLGRLSASVVHELNNPLSGILNYIRLMLKIIKRGDLDQKRIEKFQKHLTLVESETSRCSKIVSNLLAFSRKSELELSEMSINELLEKCILLSQHKLMLQNIQIKTDFDPNIPKVLGDFNQTQQCVINLIFNAIDAMSDGGTLTMVSSFDPITEMVEIKIEDTGCGIAEEDIHQIFDPFYSTKTEGKGLGLGLSMVYGIIDRHKGSITVDSKLGEGTVFTIRLPSLKREDQPKRQYRKA